MRDMENTPAPERKTYTIREASKLLGISSGQGYALARTGELPGAIKLGGRTVVSRAAIARVLDSEQNAGS